MKVNDVLFDVRSGAYHRIDYINDDGDVQATELIIDDDDEFKETTHTGYYLTKREVSKMSLCN
jgi:hypothetical protein